MKRISMLAWFANTCLLQFVPLFLQAQGALPMPGTPSLPALKTPGVSLPPPPLTPSQPVPLSPPVLPGPTGFPGAGGKEASLAKEVVEKEASEKDRISDILFFWFGWLPGPAFFPDDKMPIWFSSVPEIDRQMRNNFSQDILKAERGEYNHWRETPRGRLALILLLDQFPRHIYRNKSLAFVLDRMARAVVLEGMQKGDDLELYPIERAFFYLPLEHAEDLNLQNLSVNAYRQLAVEAPEPLQPQMQDFLRSAIMHQQQIAHFGRFPHRNEILGRVSTPEEVEFLNEWTKH